MIPLGSALGWGALWLPSHSLCSLQDGDKRSAVGPLTVSATNLLVISALQSPHTCCPQGRNQQLLLTCCKYALEANTCSKYVKTSGHIRSTCHEHAGSTSCWIHEGYSCWCCINVPSLYSVASLSAALAVVPIPLSGTVGSVIREGCASGKTVHERRWTQTGGW